MKRINRADIVAIAAFFIFLGALAALPSGATVTSVNGKTTESYKNDDLNGTTTVTLTKPCSRWFIRNISAATSVVMTVEDSTGNAALGVTIPAGATFSDQVADITDARSFIATFRLYSATTTSVEIFTGRRTND